MVNAGNGFLPNKSRPLQDLNLLGNEKNNISLLLADKEKHP